MEIIQIPGYTFEDKLPIGKIHLLPKQIKMHGLNSDVLQVTDEAMKLISKYSLLPSRIFVLFRGKLVLTFFFLMYSHRRSLTYDCHFID